MKRADRKMLELAQALLPEDEEARHVFRAQSGINPNWFSGLTFVTNQFFVVVVTNKSIVILDASVLHPGTPTGIFMRRPLRTKLRTYAGLRGKWYKQINLIPDRKLWVFSKYDSELQAADEEVQRLHG